MFLSVSYLKKRFNLWLNSLHEQGYDILDIKNKLLKCPESYDVVFSLAEEASHLPLRKDWQYNEPLSWSDIEKEMSINRHTVKYDYENIEECCKKVEAAFLSSVLGCILGKPIEVSTTMAELKKAGMSCNEWPINDFISDNFLNALGRRHPDWKDTVKGEISYVAADDDLHYSIMGMINLEKYGLNLDIDAIKNTWLQHQCINFVWGPERYILACIAMDHLLEENNPIEHRDDSYYLNWSNVFNPGTELCGAGIRVDAYGYAFPGRPDLSSKFAFIDSSFTHRKSGVYHSMFIAAAISLMFITNDPIVAFEEALKYVPQRSRFFYNTKISLEFVKAAESFEDAYQKIYQKFQNYGSCQIYQEIGTLINTMHFAEGIWDGICKQIMQGNDTDSFGCTVGSLLGILFGYENLPMDKLLLFNDELRLSLAGFHEHSLSALARRMGELPKKFMGCKG